MGRSLAERFWAKVYRTNGCWFWLGHIVGDGYGRFKVTPNDRERPAHVIAWEIHNGMPFPVGMHGTHSCDTPACVRPTHIIPRTRFGNMQDAADKGINASLLRVLQIRCKRGHKFTSANTYIGSKGERVCRRCNRLRMRAVRLLLPKRSKGK